MVLQAWEIKGKYPEVLDDGLKGKEARKLLKDAESILELMEQESITSYIMFNNKVYYLPTELALDLFYLTKLSSTPTYKEFLKYLVTRPRAIKVKIADMFHNMSCNPSEKQKQKYLKAIPILLKAL